MMLRIIGLLFLLTVNVAAQTAPPPTKPTNEQAEVLKIDTQEVLLPVTVRDRSGQFVLNLKAEDFNVYENNVLQPISSFSLDRKSVV